MSLMLTSCLGTRSGVNSERPNIISVDLVQPIVEDTKDVVVITDILDIEGKLVKGTSCQNKLWDPKPSSERAILLLKRQAKELGFTKVHSVRTIDDPTAYVKNCWSAILAFGTAYNEPKKVEE